MRVSNRFMSFVFVGMLSVVGASGVAYADRGGEGGNDGDHPHPCPSPVLPPCPEQKQAHFNIQCFFESKGDDHDSKHKHCRVNSVFEKFVTLDGGEVTDDSNYPFNPQFEVECDDQWIYKDHSRRYTEILGTRIQAEQGPYPAIVLPRGALSEGPHSVPSRLELGEDTLHGSCFIYDGSSL